MNIRKAVGSFLLGTFCTLTYPSVASAEPDGSIHSSVASSVQEQGTVSDAYAIQFLVQHDPLIRCHVEQQKALRDAEALVSFVDFLVDKIADMTARLHELEAAVSFSSSLDQSLLHDALRRPARTPSFSPSSLLREQETPSLPDVHIKVQGTMIVDDILSGTFH